MATAGLGDRLQVRVGRTPLAEFPLDQATAGFVAKRLHVPLELRGRSQTLTFALLPPSNAGIAAVVDVDNVSLHFGGRTGDIIPLDLKAAHPGDTSFGIIGWDLLRANPSGSDLRLDVDRNALRGDEHLTRAGETISYVLFSDRVEGTTGNPGEPFDSSGRLFLAPPTQSMLAQDQSAGERGFQGTMRLWYRVGESPVGVVSQTHAAGVISQFNGAASAAEKIALLQTRLIPNLTGAPVPSLSPTSQVVYREITGSGDILETQWLITDAAADRHWVLTVKDDRLDLYQARFLDVVVAAGVGGVNDAEKVVSEAASRFEVAKMQQRLRYWNYPDENGELLVVDGIVGEHTRHAAGLFSASALAADFEEREAFSGPVANYANALNGPVWTELVELPGDQFHLVEGPYQTPPRYFGTNWLTDTIRQASAAVKTGPGAIGLHIGVATLSAPNGPGNDAYPHSGHDAGLAADFVLPIAIPQAADGQVTVEEAEVATLVHALETQAYRGVTLREVRVGNADIAAAINQGRLTPLAVVDPAYAGLLHVEINPPEVLTVEPLPDPVIDEDVNDALKKVLDWLDKLVNTECDCQNLPVFVEVSDGETSAAQPATMAETLGASHVLTGSNGSLISILNSIATSGSPPTVYQLADDLRRTNVDWFLNLPNNAAVPADGSFSPNAAASYNFVSPITIYDAVGAPHAASVYFVKTAVANQWRVHLWSGGLAVGEPQLISFSPTTGQIAAPADGRLTFENFQPGANPNALNVILDLSAATQRNDVFKAGWTSWGVAAQSVFDAKTGEVALHLSLRGAGSTGDRKFDFSEALAKNKMGIAGDLVAAASIDGTLDFTVFWNVVDNSKPVGETVRVQLHEFKADVAILADTIQLDAKFGLLQGKIIDTGTQAVPGTHNSYILAHAGFDFDLNGGEAIQVGALSTLTVGEDYQLTLSCDLDGVLFYETTLAGHKIPGEMWVSLGLPESLEVKAQGALFNLLEQLQSLDPKQLADAASQLGDWLSSLANVGPFQDAMPLGGGSFGKYGDLGAELKDALLNKFQEVQLTAESAAAGVGGFLNDTTFQLTVNDQSFPVTLPATGTANNTTLADLAGDLSSAVATALDGSDLDGALVAVVSEGKLALRSTIPGVHSLRVANAEDQTTPGVERLGFGDGQAVDRLRLQTLQDLEQMLAEALGLAAGSFGLAYDPEAGTITADVSFLKESLLGSTTIALGDGYGALSSLSSSSPIDLWRRAEGSFTFGIDLAPLGTGFQITDTTPLNSLPTWGLGIETNKSAHLAITLSDGQLFSVDLSAAQTIGQARTAIQQASLVGGSPRVSVSINEAGQGLTISQLGFSAESDASARFKVAAADGSKAALVLGLLAEDDDDDGIIAGRALHGQSMVDRLYVEDFAARILVQAVAPDIDATAKFGFVEVAIVNGRGQATAEIELPLTDPSGDGRLYLSEMLAATNNANNNADGISVADVLGTPELECSLNLELPISLASSVPGLSLPGTAAVVVTCQNIHTGSEPVVYLRDLQSLQGFRGLSGIGLYDGLPVDQAIDEPLDLVAGNPELRVVLRDGSAVAIDLDAIDPASQGIARKAVQTFGDLRAAISGQSGGRVTADYSLDGRSLVLNDNTEGSGSFAVSGLHGAGILEQLGLNVPAQDGVIEGEPIYQPSVLDALRRFVELLRSFEDLDALNAPIPGTQTSLRDLLQLADKLEATLDELQNKPVESLQQLERALELALSVAGDDLAIAYENRALKIVFRWARAASQTLGLNFDLGGALGPLVDASGKAGVLGEAGANLTLALGVDLADPNNLRPFLYTNDTGTGLLGQGSQLALTARLSTPGPIHMSASLGPLGVHLRNGSVVLDSDGAGPNTTPAALTARVRDTDGDGRRYLDDLTASALATTFVGAAAIHLPTYFPTVSNPVGAITLAAPNLLAPGSFTVTTPDLSAALANYDPTTDLSAFVDGWDALLGLLEAQLAKRLKTIKLPVIGNQLGDLTRFLEDLRDVVGGNIDPATLVSATAVADLRSALFQQLSGLGFLRDINGNGVDLSDVVLNQPANAVEYRVSLGGQIVVANDLKFDLGLPGLGLKTADDLRLSLTANFRFDVGVGIDKNQGVYIALDPGKADDLHIDFRAQLTGGNLSASLGFLKLDVINNRTEAAAELDFDLNPGADGRLKLGEIFRAPLTTSFTGDVLEGGQDHNQAAVVDWLLIASIGGSANFPQLRTDFDLAWTVNSFNDLTTAPSINFGTVQMNLGSFLSDFLGPIVDQVNHVLEPVMPIVKVLTDPLPVISDLAGPVTLLDLADFFGYGDYNDFIYAVRDIGDLAASLQGVGGDSWIDLGSFAVDGKLALSSRGRGQLTPKATIQKTFDEIQSQVASGGTAGQAAAFNKSVGFAGGGGFKFPILENPASAFGLLLGQDVTLFGYDMPALQAQFEYSQFFPIFGPIGARITGSVAATVDFNFGFDTYGLRQFAAGDYTDPGAIFQGFFISDTAGVDGAGADVPEVTLSGALKAAGEVEVAVARAGVGGGIFVDGFFDLHDQSGDGKIRADELIENFQIGPLHVFDVSGTLSARLFAYYEIGVRILGKYKRIAGEEWELAEVVLLDHTLPRPAGQGPAEFSRVEGGVLKFSTTDGPDQFAVSAGAPGEIVIQSQGREERRSGVSSILFEGQGGNDRFTILDGVAVPVTVHGGSGDDHITTADGAATVHGDDGRDIIQLGSGGGTVDGGDGDDDITGSDQRDILYGGPGRDLMVGRDGNDDLFGEADADRIEGGFGDDFIQGGAGNDWVDAGRGNDRVEGNEGDDELSGGFDDDVILGGLGNDRLRGDRGSDLLIGDVATVSGTWSGDPQSPGVTIAAHSGSGSDQILGDRGDDLIFAGGGNDNVDAGAGNDKVYGQAGNDELQLGAGVDWADAGDGDDRVFGGAGSDTLYGGWGSDLIAAGATDSDQGATGETHLIYGDPTSGTPVGSTNDTLYGGRDDDQIFAGPGNDAVYARAGSDLIVGGAGKDRIFGGGSATGGGSAADVNTIYGDDQNASGGDGNEANADVIYGDVGRDVIYAGGGSDSVSALGGNNEIHLGAGHNLAIAGLGVDLIDALDGDDTIQAGDGDNTVHAGHGKNRITAGSGSDTITAGSGNDVIDAGGGGTMFQPQTIQAGSGDNTVASADGVDVITTLGGRDAIATRDGTKTISAGEGDNVITVRHAQVVITTGDGHDAIAAGTGQKVVHAGGGNNVITLGDGDSEVITGAGADVITTGNDTDRVFAGSGDNNVDAGGGFDFVQTGSGKDLIVGGAGDDILLAGQGDDRVRGQQGRDLIVGDQGDDSLDGGDGEDVLWGGLPSDAVAAWGIGQFSTAPTVEQIQQTFGWLAAFNPALGSGFASFSWMTAAGQAALGDLVLPSGFVAAEDYATTLTGRPRYQAPAITPAGLVSASVDGRNTGPGQLGDGADQIFAGEGTDWVFAGGDVDIVDGGGGADYLDAGSDNDRILGGDGDDVLRGGHNDDILRGGAGIDQLYGDQGSDLLFGDVGDATGSQAGQRLWGGPGFDTLYAFAPSYDSAVESLLWGDELIGGSDGDLLYGNLRRDLLIGDSVTQPLVGADFLHGDYVEGPLYARSESAGINGGDDFLLGGFGQDQLYGGGGPDVMFGGPDSDWLEGLDGVDQSYGGSGVDIMVLDVDSRYSVFGDAFDGHYGNNTRNDAPDDGAVDIVLVEGDRQFRGDERQSHDRIWITETAGAAHLSVHLDSLDDHGQPIPGMARDFSVNWRDGAGGPVVEQFQVSGLMGNDDLAVTLSRESIAQLSANTPGKPWHTVISGGPGNDILRGSAGRDRIDAGPGSDVAYGFAGDDRLWGDFFNGDPLLDTDVLFAGQGNDDLIGGSGSNHLFAWSRHPDLDPATAMVRDLLTDGPSETFGVYVDASGVLYDAPGPGRTLEDTGLNRMLGSSNPAASISDNPAVVGAIRYGDVLYGGTGLDFLYGTAGAALPATCWSPAMARRSVIGRTTWWPTTSGRNMPRAPLPPGTWPARQATTKSTSTTSPTRTIRCLAATRSRSGRPAPSIRGSTASIPIRPSTATTSGSTATPMTCCWPTASARGRAPVNRAASSRTPWPAFRALGSRRPTSWRRSWARRPTSWRSSSMPWTGTTPSPWAKRCRRPSGSMPEPVMIRSRSSRRFPSCRTGPIKWRTLSRAIRSPTRCVSGTMRPNWRFRCRPVSTTGRWHAMPTARSRRCRLRWPAAPCSPT